MKVVSHRLNGRMIKLKSIAVIATAVLFNACAVDKVNTNSQPITHELFTEILQSFVDEGGLVNYAQLQKDSNQLNMYLDLLSSNHPNDNFWSESERLAYWINAYNAFTLQLIIRNYPIKSIKDLTAVTIPFVHSPWDQAFISIEGREYTLNDIEHGIIRSQFNQPMIHFGLVCAAKSCPKLRTEAYTSDEVDQQLSGQASGFINDQMRNITGTANPKLSKIFQWYGAYSPNLCE